MCCTRLAANTGRKKVAKNRHLGTIPQICRAISSQLRHVSTIGKKIFSSDISPTCPHNTVNFGPLAAEIRWRVWGTPANFNGFSVIARHFSSGRQPNCGVEQRAPPIFGRAPITMGIGHTSSLGLLHRKPFCSKLGGRNLAIPISLPVLAFTTVCITGTTQAVINMDFKHLV